MKYCRGKSKLRSEYSKSYSALTAQERKLLSNEELEYLRKKEERQDRKDLRESAGSVRANINSGVGILREGRSWLRFITGS